MADARTAAHGAATPYTFQVRPARHSQHTHTHTRHTRTRPQSTTRALATRTGPRRPVQQHALDVPDPEALDDRRRDRARRKRAAEDLLKLRVEAADAQLFEIELLVLEERRRGEAALALDREPGA